MPSKTIIAIASLTLIICFAMWQGINSAIVSTGVAGIIGLGGYPLVKAKLKKGNGKEPPESPVT